MSIEHGPQRAGWSIADFYAAVGIGRTLAYKLINEGVIATVRIGRRRIVTTRPEDFLALFAEEGNHDAA
ncbi:MAG: excisionase [Rhodospirillaceae bacterium]|nr:excisionase [Rhodospirillaceae bacterium]